MAEKKKKSVRTPSQILLEYYIGILLKKGISEAVILGGLEKIKSRYSRYKMRKRIKAIIEKKTKREKQEKSLW